MSIRPIDLQVLIPKAGEATRINQIQDINSQVQQQQFAEQFQQAVQNRQKQVQSSGETRGRKVRADAESQQKKQQQNHQTRDHEQHDETKDQETKYPNPILGNHIDIKT